MKREALVKVLAVTMAVVVVVFGSIENLLRTIRFAVRKTGEK